MASPDSDNRSHPPNSGPPVLRNVGKIAAGTTGAEVRFEIIEFRGGRKRLRIQVWQLNTDTGEVFPTPRRVHFGADELPILIEHSREALRILETLEGLEVLG